MLIVQECHVPLCHYCKHSYELSRTRVFGPKLNSATNTNCSYTRQVVASLALTIESGSDISGMGLGLYNNLGFYQKGKGKDSNLGTPRTPPPRPAQTRADAQMLGPPPPHEKFPPPPPRPSPSIPTKHWVEGNDLWASGAFWLGLWVGGVVAAQVGGTEKC